MLLESCGVVYLGPHLHLTVPSLALTVHWENQSLCFPAGVYGGLKAIKAIGAAFPAMKFMPTGGVDNKNLKEFIECNKIFAVGGSWLVKGTPEEITTCCLEARKIIKGE